MIFKMAYVPPKSFPTGIGDSGSSSVTTAYQIAETEVTYELWNTVYNWATTDAGGGLRVDGGELYTFSNAGTMGDGTGDTNQHPVTTINWRDALVWTNALTEYYNAMNGTSLKPVYYSDSSYTTPIRDSSDGSYGSSVNSTAGSFDNPYIYAATSGNTDMANNTADGFRLPTIDEWDLAARYIADNNDDGDIRDSGEYYPGNYVSGADAPYDVTASSDFDGDGDTQSTVDVVAPRGSTTYEVKTKAANALGLYDMSGNAREFSFGHWIRFSETVCVVSGGSWGDTYASMQVGEKAYTVPYSRDVILGLRLSRSR